MANCSFAEEHAYEEILGVPPLEGEDNGNPQNMDQDAALNQDQNTAPAATNMPQDMDQDMAPGTAPKTAASTTPNSSGDQGTQVMSGAPVNTRSPSE